MDSRPLLTFPKWSNKLALGLLLLLATGPVYLGLLLAYGANPTTLNVGYAPTQPVPYSHALHVGKLGMDCRYCHNTVEKSGMAALPPTETCMNCHTAILPNSAKLAPVRESYKSGMPIPWVKVHDIADYVYFNHSAHVNAGVGCVECHGRVDQMEVVQTVKPLNMGWCLDCHRDPGPSLRPKDQVTNMQWTPPDRSGRLGPAAQGEVSREHEYGLRDMPSMTPDMPNHGPEQYRQAFQPDRTVRLESLTYRPHYWRSLEQLADTAEFRAGLERQPALGAEEALHASRRRFLKRWGPRWAWPDWPQRAASACRKRNWPPTPIVRKIARPATRSAMPRRWRSAAWPRACWSPVSTAGRSRSKAIRAIRSIAARPTCWPRRACWNCMTRIAAAECCDAASQAHPRPSPGGRGEQVALTPAPLPEGEGASRPHPCRCCCIPPRRRESPGGRLAPLTLRERGWG